MVRKYFPEEENQLKGNQKSNQEERDPCNVLELDAKISHFWIHKTIQHNTGLNGIIFKKL